MDKPLAGLAHDLRRLGFALIRPRRFRRLQARRRTANADGYSYRPFDENRCIFVHIPKTAGVSVSQSLFGNLAGGHDSIATYRLVFPYREFSAYFKFAFVRNPWDRLLSAYNFLRGGGMYEGDRAWAERYLSPYADFNDFVERGLRSKEVINRAHFMPQYRFLCPPGSRRILVDFVGYFEDLEEDFAYVRSRIPGSSRQPLGRRNTAGGRGGIDYRDCYTLRTRGIVGEVYRHDIALLGYDFDGSRRLRQQSRAT